MTPKAARRMVMAAGMETMVLTAVAKAGVCAQR